MCSFWLPLSSIGPFRKMQKQKNTSQCRDNLNAQRTTQPPLPAPPSGEDRKPGQDVHAAGKPRAEGCERLDRTLRGEVILVAVPGVSMLSVCLSVGRGARAVV